jgi:branched-chain amino acid transport system substrate-binding protein
MNSSGHLTDFSTTDDALVLASVSSKAEFDLLKARKGYFRSWDHQLVQEAYPFTVKPKGQAKDKQDFLAFGAAVPAANQSLEIINPPKEQNSCVF